MGGLFEPRHLLLTLLRRWVPLLPRHIKIVSIFIFFGLLSSSAQAIQEPPSGRRGLRLVVPCHLTLVSQGATPAAESKNETWPQMLETLLSDLKDLVASVQGSSSMLVHPTRLQAWQGQLDQFLGKTLGDRPPSLSVEDWIHLFSALSKAPTRFFDGELWTLVVQSAEYHLRLSDLSPSDFSVFISVMERGLLLQTDVYAADPSGVTVRQVIERKRSEFVRLLESQKYKQEIFRLLQTSVRVSHGYFSHLEPWLRIFMKCWESVSNDGRFYHGGAGEGVVLAGVQLILNRHPRVTARTYGALLPLVEYGVNRPGLRAESTELLASVIESWAKNADESLSGPESESLEVRMGRALLHAGTLAVESGENAVVRRVVDLWKKVFMRRWSTSSFLGLMSLFGAWVADAQRLADGSVSGQPQTGLLATYFIHQTGLPLKLWHQLFSIEHGQNPTGSGNSFSHTLADEFISMGSKMDEILNRFAPRRGENL